MHIQIPDLTSEQFGQLVLQLAGVAQAPGSVALQIVALQHIASGLANGTLIIAAPTDEQPEIVE